MNDAKVKEFFSENAQGWVMNGYNDDGYNYPTALHRARIIKKILQSKESKLNIADLGCGAGNVSLMLAELGHSVIGIDESEKMIEMSENERNKLSNSIKNNVKFNCESITNNSLKKGKYDICIAMGIIGYFENDETLFKEVKRLLKPEGIFIVSCRNRLFNMKSITFRTKNEINNNYAIALIDEIEGLYDKVPIDIVENMINNMKENILKLPDHTDYDEDAMKSPSHKSNNKNYEPFYEPRQHTPKYLNSTAKQCGFKNIQYYGVHPHLLDPNLNKMFPPKIFNQISSFLEPLEELPISLVWSSVFIGVFSKE